MDDMTLVDSDPRRLQAMVEPIDIWLRNKRSQHLNSDKTTLKAAARSSIDYLGYRLQLDRMDRSKLVYVTVDPKKKWDFVKELRLLERNGVPHGTQLHPLWLSYSHRASREAWSAVRSREGHLKHARMRDFVCNSLARTHDQLNSRWVDLSELEF